MATMNLYLPEALKAEMDQQQGVNWSKVAQDAFRQALEIERTKKVDMIEASIQRLRSERGQKVGRQEAQATAAGKRWALEAAKFEELEAVATIESGGEAWTGEPGAYGWGHCLADAIYGEDKWDRADLEHLCETHFGSGYPSAKQVRAFIDGAAEVFNRV